MNKHASERTYNSVGHSPAGRTRARREKDGAPRSSAGSVMRDRRQKRGALPLPARETRTHASLFLTPPSAYPPAIPVASSPRRPCARPYTDGLAQRSGEAPARLYVGAPKKNRRESVGSCTWRAKGLRTVRVGEKGCWTVASSLLRRPPAELTGKGAGRSATYALMIARYAPSALSLFFVSNAVDVAR